MSALRRVAREQQAGKRASLGKSESKAAARSSRGRTSSERRPSSAADSEAPIMAAPASSGVGSWGRRRRYLVYRGGDLFLGTPQLGEPLSYAIPSTLLFRLFLVD